MVQLTVKDLAEARGLNQSKLSRKADIPLSTVRRLWFGTRDGREKGQPLKHISLEVLETAARFFGVEPGELLRSQISVSNQQDMQC